ncbi:hypothetical protein QBC41DRAFT_308045 [Cercophora samala]|uniref:Uncharacterized protein n=1 Tax=Cercophora samala TaxID=330535 RepID=A0AA40D3P9_9PEZI|nr:hypothetical protein QBC41DRAFT_308045 [Cercophora samala]
MSNWLTHAGPSWAPASAGPSSSAASAVSIHVPVAAAVQPGVQAENPLPTPPGTRNYGGSHRNTVPVPPQPPNSNLSFWIENLPANITHASFYKLVLPGPHFGRVYQVHINPPCRGHATSAAKLTFFDVGGASRFFNTWCTVLPAAAQGGPLGQDSRWRALVRGPRVFCLDTRITVFRHRNPVYEIPTDVVKGVATGGPRHSRVLVFIGSVEKVNREWLARLFTRFCKSWEVEAWEESEPWGFIGRFWPGRTMPVRKMVVRFGSYRFQAETIWGFFHRGTQVWDGFEDMREGVACGFGWDPCSYGQSDPSWGWEMGGIEWRNRNWQHEDMVGGSRWSLHDPAPSPHAGDYQNNHHQNNRHWSNNTNPETAAVNIPSPEPAAGDLSDLSTCPTDDSSHHPSLTHSVSTLPSVGIKSPPTPAHSSIIPAEEYAKPPVERLLAYPYLTTTPPPAPAALQHLETDLATGLASFRSFHDLVMDRRRRLEELRRENNPSLCPLARADSSGIYFPGKRGMDL